MDVAREWLQPTDAHWKDQEKTWIFPSGATLSFGYLDNPNDVYRYQGAQFHFAGFDELTQIREYDYNYISSRTRRLKTSDIPIRKRSASNPGGSGHVWVKQRFIVEGLSHNRIFIPAKLEDNPYIDKDTYVKSLANLDPLTRTQLLEGDWDIRADKGMFKREWLQIVDAYPTGRTVRYWDLAATEAKQGKDPDYTSGARITVSDGRYFISDIRRVRLSPGGVESLIRQCAELDGKSTYIYMEQEPGASGVNTIDHYQRSVLPGWIFKGIKSTGSKELRAAPFSSQCEAGNVKLVQGKWINDFLDELESFPGGDHDDQVDAASGAMEQLMANKSLYIG